MEEVFEGKSKKSRRPWNEGWRIVKWAWKKKVKEKAENRSGFRKQYVMENWLEDVANNLECHWEVMSMWFKKYPKYYYKSLKILLSHIFMEITAKWNWASLTIN